MKFCRKINESIECTYSCTNAIPQLQQNACKKEDRDAPQTAAYSDLSCVSEADSSAARRHKLSKLGMSQMAHLRAIKRKAHQRLANVHSRGKGGSAKHLQGLVDDISVVLSPVQTREHDGKFGSTVEPPF